MDSTDWSAFFCLRLFNWALIRKLILIIPPMCLSLGPFGVQRGTQEDGGLFFLLFFLCGTFDCRTLSQAMALIPEVQKGKDEEDLANRHLQWRQKPCLAPGTTAASHSQTCCAPNPSLIDSEDLLYAMYLLLNYIATM